MKALTLHQPYATLIMEGKKVFETRSWPAPRNIVGTRIAIHAGKTLDSEALDEFYDEHELAWVMDSMHDSLGKVLGTVQVGVPLLVVRQMRNEWVGRPHGTDQRALFGTAPEQAHRDDLMGDYHPGRYAWPLTDVVVFDEPIPARGHQGIWDWTQ